MKMIKTHIVTALMLLCATTAWATKHQVTKRQDIAGANQNGEIKITLQNAEPGDTVKLYSQPSQNYGMSRGIFYATRNADGTYSATKTAVNSSTYKDACANEQQFWFIMPDAPVEVWAFFIPVRTLIIHQATGGSLEPLYGFEKTRKDTIIRNIPYKPLKLKVIPDIDTITYEKNELLDVTITNVDAGYYSKTPDLITVVMPVRNDTIHVTPVFGKRSYKIDVQGQSDKIQVALSNTEPKAREEVDVTLTTAKGHIPSNVTFEGCQSWWRVGKPQRNSIGGWKIDYRVKVDTQNVTIKVGHEQVYAYTVKDAQNSGRIKTYMPEMIADFPGVAREGQQVPILFKMPKNFGATYTARKGGVSLPTTVYKNALKNSFADQGMYGWRESDDFVSAGHPMITDTDSTGNKFWRTSVKNSMSQSMVLAGRANKDNPLNIAAIVSMNPRRARCAEASIVASGKDMKASKQVIADMEGMADSWQTVFKMLEVDAKADTLKFVISAQADNADNKYGYDGPMFDDLCLLLPTAGNTVKDEDVLVFTMGEADVTINYTPTVGQSTVSVDKSEHATITLTNTTTSEQGTTVKAMQNDLITVKGKYAEGYAIYNMNYTQNENMYAMQLDSINTAVREVYYHFVMFDDGDVTIIPDVDEAQVTSTDYYGGSTAISNAFAREGEKVQFTIKTNDGCKLRKINTEPAGIVTITADNVDAATGAGTYSFVMPAGFVKVKPEYVVPISSASELTKIFKQRGEFVLTNDLDLGTNWNKAIALLGDFNGNGHRITYGGKASLFSSIGTSASVRHLYVKANIESTDNYIGGIARTNNGIIEDCEVTGTIKTNASYATAAGVAGQNSYRATIARCHVLCEAIDATMVYGIAYQQKNATTRGNVFNGKFVNNDRTAYLICNGDGNSTVEDNYYIANEGNARADSCQGVTAGNPVALVDEAKRLTDSHPVYAASIKSRYLALNVTTALPDVARLLSISPTTTVAGTIVSGSVRVTGNNHLDSIIVSAPDGSAPRSCTFTDNTENLYNFSFAMPDHDVLVTFKTQEGTLIYTAEQLADISSKSGTYILARDIDLNKWNKMLTLAGTFYGRGHTIKYEATGSFHGLFYQVTKNAVLDGLRVVANVESDVDCAGIAYSNQGTIRDCHFCGRLSRIKSLVPSLNHVSAIACTMGKTGLIDHCSATGELISSANQDAVNKAPLCMQSDADIRNSLWIDATQTDKHQELMTLAETARHQYPVYAQGIFDQISVRIIAGNDTIQVPNGQTLDELTITDGEPFVCTADVKVNRIVYKRKAMTALEQWILPFSFDRMAGNGTFEYHPTIEEKKLPDILPGQTLTLSQTPSPIAYQANDPWLVKTDGSDLKTFVLTNAAGPVTIKPTYNDHIARYASTLHVADFYATYENIPAMIAKSELMYTWDTGRQEFGLVSDSLWTDITPYRYYLKFYNQSTKKYETYEDTWWAQNNNASNGKTTTAAPRRLASVVADGWQPVFLDPRQPQSVTARMLDYYEVAYLADIRGEVADETSDNQLSLVSLIYQMVDSRMELPAAIPLLVRAKRSDAEPLVDSKTGAELDSLMMQSLIHELLEEEGEEAGTPAFEMPHYWCASLGNRLDVWPLPSSEKYADLAELGGMMFEDNYFDQSFTYATADDTRTTTPMSYCITVLDTDTYELLPLIGDRVSVEFVGSGEATGIDTVQRSTFNVQRSTPYNLSGQRVSKPTKGLYIMNGRKVVVK